MLELHFRTNQFQNSEFCCRKKKQSLSHIVHFENQLYFLRSGIDRAPEDIIRPLFIFLCRSVFGLQIYFANTHDNFQPCAITTYVRPQSNKYRTTSRVLRVANIRRFALHLGGHHTGRRGNAVWRRHFRPETHIQRQIPRETTTS